MLQIWHSFLRFGAAEHYCSEKHHRLAPTKMKWLCTPGFETKGNCSNYSDAYEHFFIDHHLENPRLWATIDCSESDQKITDPLKTIWSAQFYPSILWNDSIQANLCRELTATLQKIPKKMPKWLDEKSLYRYVHCHVFTLMFGKI